MHEITDEQRERFKRFREAYMAEWDRLEAEGASGSQIAAGNVAGGYEGGTARGMGAEDLQDHGGEAFGERRGAVRQSRPG